jgi:hypothetical protein
VFADAFELMSRKLSSESQQVLVSGPPLIVVRFSRPHRKVDARSEPAKDELIVPDTSERPPSHHRQ